jgi:NADH-quinone oxidoreductase subunit N
MFYYLRVIKLMYFDAPPEQYPAPQHSAGVRFALGINALAVLVLGIVPAPLLDLCSQLIR